MDRIEEKLRLLQPFLPRTQWDYLRVQYLFEKATNYSCCIPQENQYTEPLCCVYNTVDVRTCIPTVIEQDNKRIWNLIECLPNPRYIPFEEIRKIDPCLLSFKNINTFSDLEYAETLIDKGGSP